MFKSTLSAPREFFVRMVRSGKVIYLTIRAVSLKRAKQKFIRQNIRQLPHIKWEIQDEPFRHIVDEYVPQNDEFLEDTVEWFLRAQLERIEKMRKKEEQQKNAEYEFNQMCELIDLYEKTQEVPEDFHICERCGEDCDGWKCVGIKSQDEFAHLEWI